MEIKEYSPYNESEIVRLYSDVGWTAYTDDLSSLRRGFAHSLLTLAAYDGDELLGLIRAVGDGATIVCIQDILVLRQHQRKRIGTALMKAMLERFVHVRQIVLLTDDTPQTTAFYRSAGFRELEKFGCCGFMLCR